MAYNKVIYDGRTLIDLTDLDVTASDVKSGITFILADGTKAVGTLVSTSTPTANTIAEWDSSAHMNSEDMTAQEVQDFVDGLDYSGTIAVDYIVEQGTSGDWTYRKWNSGIAECWGVHTETLSNYTTGFGGYAYSTTVSFPSGLFIIAPFVTFSVSIGTQLGICGVAPENTLSTSSVSLYGISNSSGSKSTVWRVRAIGKWK